MSSAKKRDGAAEIGFVVEQAGCASCAALVERALTPLAPVHAIEVDEAADCAAVKLAYAEGLSPSMVDRALAEASVGSGHEYRTKPGSWTLSP